MLVKLFAYLIGSGGEPFHVDIDPSLTISDLKGTILGGDGGKLLGVHPAYLKIYAGSLPDGHDLEERASKFVENEPSLAVTRSISDCFTIPPPSKTIHVVVKKAVGGDANTAANLPQSSSGLSEDSAVGEWWLDRYDELVIKFQFIKGAMSNNKETVLKSEELIKWKTLYNLVWGKESGAFIKTDATTAAKYFDLTSVSQSYYLLLIRDEYRDILNILERESLDREKRGALITGQPGVGKSVSLLYILISRLSRKLRTAYQDQPGHYHLFDTDGVQRLKDNVTPPSTTEDETWALTDSNSALPRPSGAFTSLIGTHFLVQAASPFQDRYKGWTKERNAVFVLMDIWSWAEMNQLISIRKLDWDLVHKLYHTWGPSAKVCVTKKSVHGQLPKVQQALSESRTKIGEVLRSMSNSGDAASSGIAAPHSVFYIRPTKPLNVGESWIVGIQVYIPTDTLRQHCFRTLLSAEAERQQEFFDVLSTNPLSRSTSGYMLEKWMHLHFSGSLHSGSSLTYRQEVEYFDSVNRESVGSFPVPGRIPVLFGPTFTEGSLVDGPPYYLLPRQMNQASFDGVVLTERQVIVLQATVATKHPIKRKGILELLTLLPGYHKHDWVFIYYVHQKSVGCKLCQVRPLVFDLKDRGLKITLQRYYTVCPMVPLAVNDIAFSERVNAIGNITHDSCSHESEGVDADEEDLESMDEQMSVD